MYPPIDEAAIAHACDVLASGGLVAIPTETVYGLAADADNRDAVLRTFAVKKRPTTHPLIVHVASVDALDAWASRVPEEARILAARFWPGPLTMVLPKSDRCGDFVTGGQDTVAIRCPSHPWIHALLTRFAGPTMKGLTAPSANTFGHISPTCARHVADDLGVKPEGKLDYILNGGTCEVGVESTIINLSGERPEILRHGAVTRAMLEDALGRPIPDGGAASPRVSGTLKSHYAPETKLEIVPAEMLVERILSFGNDPVAVMARKRPEGADNIRFFYEAPCGHAAYAHVLYEALHELDAAHAVRILVEMPPQTAEWAAVNDRLGRAAADKPAKRA
ncbi:MAG: L-threonylcarbamoyladenylate synthase [Duodenibacillus sp.]|nr:L-threonylcarbamoyladenylate synthase [Duodenibacillus sp.]